MDKVRGIQGETNLKTTLFKILALSLTMAASAPALADEGRPNFPMPAAEFAQRVDARLSRAKGRMERYITENKVDDQQAQTLRARFDLVAGEIEAEVQKAGADGTVTRDEARAVRQVARQLPFHHRSHRAQPDA
jgi:hypothetical protein